MLAAILICLYITLIAGLYGWLALRCLGWIFPMPELPGIPFTILALAGLALAASLSSLLSLAIPIGLAANLILLLAGGAFAAATAGDFRLWISRLFSQLKALRVIQWAALIFAAAGILGYGVISPLNYDSGLYHAQAIRWIETYRAVPGLGNLASRLAYDSSWLVLSAVFSFSFLGMRSFHLLDAWLCLFLFIYLLGALDNLLAGKITWSSLIKLATLLPAVYFLVRDAASPGTDIPAAILTWVVFLFFLDGVEAGNARSSPVAAGVLLLLAFFAVTVKLAALPLLILPVYQIWAARKQETVRRMWWAAPVLAAVIFLPWFARNVVLSGYLVYPFAAVDIFRFDWKIPHAAAVYEQRTITAWARIPGGDTNQVLAMPFGVWFPQWLSKLSRWFKLIFAGTGALLLFFAALFLSAPRRGLDWVKKNLAVIVLAATALIGLAFWFWNAPDPRFGYGYIFFTLFILAAPVAMWLARRFSTILATALIAGVLLFQGGLAIKAALLPGMGGYLVLPADYPSASLGQKQTNNFTINYPLSGDQCWYAPLPCEPYPNTEVVLRGAGLQNGFRNIKVKP
jgi:hypothetical protein